jgi:hypothetical protein
MRLTEDRRGATVQVGAVLLAGVLVLSLSGYQALVVPAETASAEANHQVEVQGSLGTLDDAIARAGVSGSTRPVTVPLGTDYPNQLLAVTPPPASGSLRTEAVSPGSTAVAIEDARALNGETADYWNGTRTFSTRALVYRPSYNEFDGGATVALAPGVRVAGDRSPGGSLRPIGGQTLVDGRRLTLVTLAGGYDASGSGTVTVDPRALSPQSTRVRSVAVRNATGGNVTLRVPTRLSAAQWQALLADEPRVQGVTDVSGGVAVTLDPGVYELRLVAVGVGSGATAPDARYLTTTGRGNLTRTVPAGTTETLTVEARDRYDNPVSGVAVEATVEGAGAGPGSDLGRVRGPRTVTTDGSGRARFVYEAPVDGPANATVNVSFGPGNASTRVDFRVGVPDTGRRLVWDTRYDWDAGPDATRQSLVYADFGDHESTTVELGEGNESRGLIAYWSLDDDSGPEATDAASGTVPLDGSSSGVTFDANGTLGTSSVAFDGATGAYLENDSTGGTLAGLRNLTVVAWVRSDVVGSSGTVNSGVFSTDSPADGDGQDDGVGLRYDDEAYFAGTNGNPTSNNVKASVSVDTGSGVETVQYESSGGVQTTDWQHLAFTWSSGAPVRLYVDGSLDDPAYSGDGDGNEFDGGATPPAGTTVTSETGAAGLYVGAGTKGDPWDGRIDEVRIYDRNLSAGTIRRLYNGTRPTTPPERWNGSIRTAYGLFDASVNATNLSVILEEGNNSVPAGTNVTLVVQADPDADGVFENTSAPLAVTPSTDLSTARPVRNLTVESARYRLRVDMNASDVTAGPELDRVVLEVDS